MKKRIYGLGLAITVAMLLGAQRPHSTAQHAAPADAAKQAPSAPKRDVAWANLLAGNVRFVSGAPSAKDFVGARKALAAAQHPRAIVLTCSDSRVAPELVFDTALGHIFVVRTAGNVTDAVGLGSIEYAVEHLHVSTLVVLGHTSCGAVGAAVAGGPMPTPNLAAIVKKIAPAVAATSSLPEGKRQRAAVDVNVRQSASDILRDSPIVKEAVGAGHLQIVKAVYDLSTGRVEALQ